MKQILQNLGSGETLLLDVPVPRVKPGHLLIRTSLSLVSAGTERMLVRFGRSGWLEKARQQPEKVKQVLAKIRSDGLLTTLDAIQRKLDQPLPLGYSNVGVVVEVGEGVVGFAVGDRVLSNGPHAEYVCVPKNLCAKIPASVTDEQAVFGVVGAIALQGIRLASPSLGENVAVVGLGLIGLIAVQLLRANGCRVIGFDPSADRCELARSFGAEATVLESADDALASAQTFSRGRGVDAVLITAATDSNEPVSLAARMSRKRGKIILVGVAGLKLARSEFYEKELSFQVSCSYGPGRYDKQYEAGGQDYPIGFVRWTEQRNFEAFLDIAAAGGVDTGALINRRYQLAEVQSIYDSLMDGAGSLGIIIEHKPDRAGSPGVERTVALPGASKGKVPGPGVAFIGAGSYGGAILMPAFRAAGAAFRTVITDSGVNGVHFGAKHGFAHASTEPDDVFADDEVGAVVIATRHDSHAKYVARALGSGRHVFCEKPLAITLEELAEIRDLAVKQGAPVLMVGFNRRFAPHVRALRVALEARPEPKAIIMTINAGAIPRDHWTQSLEEGGGRIIGEACHWIDLQRYLVGAPIVGWSATCAKDSASNQAVDDVAVISLEFADGSIGTIHYVANGPRALEKERYEVFVGERHAKFENFRRLSFTGWGGQPGRWSLRQDKGHRACAQSFLDAAGARKPAPIPVDELIEVSRVAIEVGTALRSAVANRGR